MILNFHQKIPLKKSTKKSIEKGNGSFLEENIFQLIIKKMKKKNKKRKDYKIECIQGEDAYEFLISVWENTFIYDIELKKDNKWLDNIIKEDIDQKLLHFKIN